MVNSEIKKIHTSHNIIKIGILVFWILFWLLNVIDKVIGGAHFLFVGKDRFALFERYFDSIGLGNPIVANIALIISSGLELFAFIFFFGALLHLMKKNSGASRSWFFIGIVLTLTIFTFFSIGDQFFGDHFELLEHGIYLLITILSWFIFIHIDKIKIPETFSIEKKQTTYAALLDILLICISTFAIFKHNNSSFVERTEAVKAEKISHNKFKIQFPFLAGSKAFENTLTKFKTDYPGLTINYIYTAPHTLRLGEADGLIIYLQTEAK